MQAASKLVKTGGILVYATCSILYDENQTIVKQFLEKNLNFKLMPAQSVFGETAFITSDGYLELLPHITNTDGFFAAKLTRIS